MASNFLTPPDCIGLLRRLYPIRKLIHVGDLNKHTLSEYAEWTSAPAIFVIADEEQHRSLTPLVEGHPGWSSLHAVAAELASERDYFKASNPRESGLLAPESLAGIWRNIKTLSQTRVLATTLDSVLGSSPRGAPTVNWIIVNCLSALPVIQGATHCIAECDVIVSRAVLDESVCANPSTTASALDEYLTGFAFRRISVNEERNPALGTVIYVRDWRAALQDTRDERKEDLNAASHRLIEELTADRDEQFRLVEQYRADLEKSVRERDGTAYSAAELQLQFDRLTQDRDRLAQELSAQSKLTADHQALISQMTTDLEEQTHIANQRHKERENASRECDVKTRLAEERQRQIDQLILERDRIAQELSAQLRLASENQALIAQISANRDEHGHLANQRSSELERVTREFRDLASVAEERQRQLDHLTRGHDRIAQELVAQTQLVAEREALNTQIAAERDEKTGLAGQLSRQLEQAVLERGDQARLAEEARGQLNQVMLERDRAKQELAAHLDLLKDREALIIQITAERDEQTSVANQRHKEREQAGLDRDAHALAAGELRTRVEQLSQAADQCEQKLIEATERNATLGLDLDKHAEKISELQSALAEFGASREKALAELIDVRVQVERMSATLEERGARIRELEVERNDLQERQLRLDREIVKAEAQIDLIKDVVLRDKAF
jgi:hypothetical protein